ncbi:MAG: SpoIID/LytB domain-containing protein [Clostridia bacterium]|nr:SpoIID/LytB domain-containing protein [Clostridia bacterium]
MSSLKSKRNRAERQKFVFRILAIIMAILMVGGTLYSAFYIFFVDLHAADFDAYALDSDASSIPYVTVGIIYADDSPVYYPLRSPSGFVVGTVHSNRDHRSFTPLFTLPQTTLTPALNANVAKNNDAYSVTDEYYKTKIGAYHIQLNSEMDNDTILKILPDIDGLAKSVGHYAFPAYINGKLCIRVGDFAAYEQTQNTLNQISAIFNGFQIEIVAPSATATSLIDPANDHIAFEYDSGEDYYMGLAAIQTGGEEQNYLQTPSNNLYEGVFAVSRYTTDSIDGITIFNILDLEAYTEGVLPYEISSSWPKEALRAFAITIRSFALANWGAHDKAYGFDMCTHHCQSYRGRNKVTASIIEAVASSAGEILSYDGKVVSSFYSSTDGGESVSLNAAWGGPDSGYIVMQKTPWERYSEHHNGSWVTEVSPAELAAHLREMGYTDLTQNIANITVNSYAGEDSGYVKSLTFTDAAGHSVTVTNTDKVRSALYKYLNSANFVIGRGSLSYSLHEVQSIKVTDRLGNEIIAPKDKDGYNPADHVTQEAQSLLGVPIFTAAGVLTTASDSIPLVFTADGLAPAGISAHLLTGTDYALMTQNYTVFSDPDPSTGLITAQTAHGSTLITTVLKPITKSYTASSPNNFIFAGKGWGHGVGLSQYGIYDLSKAGALAETMLEIYFPGSEIVDRASLGY